MNVWESLKSDFSTLNGTYVPNVDHVVSNEESSDPFEISNSLKQVFPGAPALIIDICALHQGSRGYWQSSVYELPARMINYFDLHWLNAKTTIVEALLVPTVPWWSTWEMYSQASIDTKTSLRRTGILFAHGSWLHSFPPFDLTWTERAELKWMDDFTVPQECSVQR